ncbi:NUDIX domain-containing protein [Candidatus Azambacteria bacterium]|nr:NUDIX domain-containing protein [Candidatus Azambacteria bacterium]
MNQKKIVQKVVLAGVVMNEGKILILQRHSGEDVYPGIWELPSGKREALELSEESLAREVKEESGLDIKIISPFSMFDYQIEKPDEIRDSTQINFLVIPINNPEVILSSEHQAFVWIGVDEIDRYDITEDTKKVIKKGFEFALLLKLV